MIPAGLDIAWPGITDKVKVSEGTFANGYGT